MGQFKLSRVEVILNLYSFDIESSYLNQSSKTLSSRMLATNPYDPFQN